MYPELGYMTLRRESVLADLGTFKAQRLPQEHHREFERLCERLLLLTGDMLAFARTLNEELDAAKEAEAS